MSCSSKFFEACRCLKVFEEVDVCFLSHEEYVFCFLNMASVKSILEAVGHSMTERMADSATYSCVEWSLVSTVFGRHAPFEGFLDPIVNFKRSLACL